MALLEYASISLPRCYCLIMSLADKGSITYCNGEKYAVSVASVKEMLDRTLVQAVLLFVF